MSRHEIAIDWSHHAHKDDANTYSRNHKLMLGGDQVVAASAGVDFKGDSNHADPEQLFIGAVASCHMLTFLAVAELQGYEVTEYRDNAVGFLEKAEGGMSVTRIERSPQVSFGGEKIPDDGALKRLHMGAHKNCFIGRSVRSQIVVLKDGVSIF